MTSDDSMVDDVFETAEESAASAAAAAAARAGGGANRGALRNFTPAPVEARSYGYPFYQPTAAAAEPAAIKKEPSPTGYRDYVPPESPNQKQSDAELEVHKVRRLNATLHKTKYLFLGVSGS